MAYQVPNPSKKYDTDAEEEKSSTTDENKEGRQRKPQDYETRHNLYRIVTNNGVSDDFTSSGNGVPGLERLPQRSELYSN